MYSAYMSVPRSLAAHLLVLVLLSSATSALAQTGSISGRLVDSETGETLIGANAVVEGSTMGATTDLEGRYEIRAVDAGTYTVGFSFIGYASRFVQNVRVEAGETVRIDLALTPEALGLEEVVVEATAVRNAEAALLRERQKSAAVSDAISAEGIGRSGSASAADAMRRVTGASVVGGKYVYVRGLGDRYVNTQLNGSTLPSADPDRNAVPLDLFPAGLLDNIVTAKTFTPDRPGSFTGGSVNIGTRSFPERFSLSLSSSAGYNSQIVGSSPFLTYETGSTDWLGFDDGTRGIGSSWTTPGANSPNHVQARRDPALARQLDEM